MRSRSQHRGYDVFICHRRHDSSKLSVGIHKYLNSHGVPTFCDLVDDPDYALGNRIYDLIRETPIFLFVASAGALDSVLCKQSWVRQELDCAVASKRTLFSMQVGDFEASKFKQLPPCIFKLLEKRRIVLNAGRPTSAAFTSLLDSITFSRNGKSREVPDIFDSSVLTRKDLPELIKGVCNTLIVKTRPSEIIAAGSLKRWLGNAPSEFTVRSLITAGAGLESAQARSILTRAIVVGVLRTLSRDESRSLRAFDLRPLWPLLFPTLSRESGLPIHATQSAQGFVAVPLYSIVKKGSIRELLRLHFWTPETKTRTGKYSGPPPAKSFAVHSHQPHAQSWLLAGSLRNTFYRITRLPTRDPRDGLTLFSLRWDGHRRYSVHQKSSRVTNTGQPVRIESECSMSFEAGQSYVIPAGKFHETTAVFSNRAAPILATLFFFDSSKGWIEDAGVVGPSHTPHSECPRSVKTDMNGLLKLAPPN